MLDGAIGIVIGIVIGHFVPDLYTKAVAYIKSKTAAKA